MRAALALSLLLMGTTLAGCIGSDGGDELDEQNLDLPGADIPGPAAEAYDRSGDYSRTLTEGLFGILPGVSVDIASTDGTMINAGVFLPEIEGCDWEASELPDECQVPVIMDVGPYYGDSDTPSHEPANRLGGFLIDNLVPHGYAVVQASVRGTGTSDGCNDFLGPAEQEDVDSFVTHFGTVAWSNGNVGIIGRSYDGTTPWEGAQFGNEHLTTIVPISGLSDVGDMYWRNGSSESRAPILGTVYSSFALDSHRSLEQVAMVICPETAMHPAFGVAGYANGGYVTPAGEMPYWADRNYQPEVLANYEGSVWVIHGLQDWNVDPHMAFPFARELQEAGIDVKVWAGQWQHDYPDRPNDHDHLRWDWAEALKAWFDHYLKGMDDVDPGLTIETEDNYGNWRVESAWPPRDVEWTPMYLAGDGELAGEPGAAGSVTLVDPYATAAATEFGVPAETGMETVSFTTEPFAQDTRLIGLPRLHVDAMPMGPGGQLYAELYEVGGDAGRILVGHAQMDLRYHAGGMELQLVVPGEMVNAKMEFFPLDVLVPAGSQLELVIRQSHPVEPLPTAVQTPVMVHWGDDSSVLSLPVGQTDGVFYTVEGVDPESTW